MTKPRINKTLLAVGDEKDWDSYLKFLRQTHMLRKHGVDFMTTDYDSVLADDFPAVRTRALTVFLFFPFEYWDRHIEPRRYMGVYGSRDFYSKLKTFWKTVDRKIRGEYGDRKLSFISAPGDIPPERDKEAAKRLLRRAGIEAPRSFRSRDIAAVLSLLEKGRELFVKVRYGSMGKGITYLERDRWLTNFAFRQKRILNRHSDYGWRFRDVTGNRAFLRELLRSDVVVEEAVPRWIIRNRHFDLRALVFRNKVLYMYPRSNDAARVTTNVSQGARSETMSFLADVPRKLVREAERTAVAAAKALRLGFAGVDMMLDPHRKRAVVIELNAFPGFPKVRRFNLAKHLVREIGGAKWK